MKYEWKTDLGELKAGKVVEALICAGEMYQLEIQEHDNDMVVGSVWAETPATFWEPADMTCVLEREYESIGAAKHFLELFDREAAEDQARWDARQDELDRQYFAYLDLLERQGEEQN